MKNSLLTTLLAVGTPILCHGMAFDSIGVQSGRTLRLAYQKLSSEKERCVRVYNFTDAGKGFTVYSGEKVIGYSTEGNFDINTAPPALVAILEAIPNAADSDQEDNGKWIEVAPLSNQRGYTMWNQDSPFNDLCPEYEISKRSPTGCVATAMAQVMYYHQWPKKGTGSHTYSPAILYGNTLTADFGNTEYQWDAMLPSYRDGYTDRKSREAVAELMLHCGIAVDMVYYTQSGATDYDVPPALVNYFGYDRSLAYRKREHYSTQEWLRIINMELLEGRPILAYGKSSSGGHAFVFDGMDSDGFIHVNWGWGGMSNGYFNTSVLTPPVQGIGGADGGFNYSQRIITGIRPADTNPGDYHIEITSTEGLTAGKKKISQGDDVKIKLSGKVYNHGWRDSEFDYALVLTDMEQNVVKVIDGPTGKFLAMDANDYAPDFGNVSLGILAPGVYTLKPAVRSVESAGEWIPVRDEYIGYPNLLKVTATEDEISFASYDYFNLKASDVTAPEVIWSGLPTLITAKIANEGDVEYHGEVRAVLYSGNNISGTTSNYIIDLEPGETTTLRFTDAFNISAGEYTLALLNDDGQKICTPIAVEVKEVSGLGSLTSATKIDILEASDATVSVKTHLKADGMFQGLLYAFIYDASGKLQQGCLYPEYIALEGNDECEVTLSGEFENGIPDTDYLLRLAVYSQGYYTFLEDDNSYIIFQIDEGLSVDKIESDDNGEFKYYDFNGFKVDPRSSKFYKRVKIAK